MRKMGGTSSLAVVRYTFRDSWRLVIRHWGMSLLTILTAMAVFYVIGTSILFVLNVRNAVNMMEGHLSIQAYIKPDAKIEETAAKIKKLENVRDIEIVTKEMALERLRARIGNQAEAVSLLGENPLPPSIEVRVSNAAHVSETAGKLAAMEEVEDLVYAGKVAEKLAKLSSFVEKFSIGLLLIAVITSGVVLFNTIRISVYSRESEIDVMLLVGATPTYVAMPFVFQGFILGFTGALLASLLVGGTYYSAVAKIQEMLPFLVFIESPQLMLKLAFMLVCCGGSVSLIASLLAVEKFIRIASRPL